MPSGPRIRSNNAYGVTTDNPLTSGAAAFNSTQLVLLPDVTAAHAVIVLDPKRVFGQPEIVVVTAHTGLSTIATILRGKYSTIARSHPVGTAWAHVTVDEDYVEILTSITRPTDPFEGQSIYETDTDSIKTYSGVVWNSSPPVGTLLSFLGATAPTGYLLANGAEASRTGITADLFAVVGTTYGIGNNSTTFNLPNLQGRIPVGRDATQSEFDVLGEASGAKTHVLTQAQMALHTHGVTDGHHNHTQSNHTHGITDSQHAHGLTGGAHRHAADGDYGNRWGVSHGSTQNQMWVGLGQGTLNAALTDIDLEDVTSVGGASGGTNLSVNNNASNLTPGGQIANLNAAATGISLNDAGSNTPHNNLQPYLVVNYIVKI